MWFLGSLCFSRRKLVTARGRFCLGCTGALCWSDTHFPLNWRLRTCSKLYRCIIVSLILWGYFDTLEIYNEIQILEVVFLGYVHVKEQHMLFEVGRVRFYPVFSSEFLGRYFMSKSQPSWGLDTGVILIVTLVI